MRNVYYFPHFVDRLGSENAGHKVKWKKDGFKCVFFFFFF